LSDHTWPVWCYVGTDLCIVMKHNSVNFTYFPQPVLGSHNSNIFIPNSEVFRDCLREWCPFHRVSDLNIDIPYSGIEGTGFYIIITYMVKDRIHFEQFCCLWNVNLQLIWINPEKWQNQLCVWLLAGYVKIKSSGLVLESCPLVWTVLEWYKFLFL
jgi:hypothetical protein